MANGTIVAKRFEAAIGDDYNVDPGRRRWLTGWRRLSPKCMHRSACGTEFWGYAPDEALRAIADLIDERVSAAFALRPGYPAQPDHTEKAALFQHSGCGGGKPECTLTESYAMWPPARRLERVYTSAIPEIGTISASGKIEKRSGGRLRRAQGHDGGLKTAERWLAPILNYEPV